MSYNIFRDIISSQLILRGWRNWHTRTVEGRMVYTVWVQVPPRAPELETIMKKVLYIILILSLIYVPVSFAQDVVTEASKEYTGEKKPAEEELTEEEEKERQKEEQERVQEQQETIERLNKQQEFTNVQRSLENIRRINEFNQQRRNVEEINKINQMQKLLDDIRRLNQQQR